MLQSLNKDEFSFSDRELDWDGLKQTRYTYDQN
jgi:hypothetical protein